MSSLFSFAFCLALVASPGLALADIYKTIDKDGSIRFTSRPTTKGAAPFLRDSGIARPDASRVAPQDRDPARFERYDAIMVEAAALYQIPVALVRAVVKVESDYDPRAVSRSNARGLMQLMGPTAEAMGVKDMHDPRENIFGGVCYLRVLANTFNGDLSLTVAGYNAGETAVIRAGGIPAYQETRDYVVRVLRYYERYRSETDTIRASGPLP